jgi:hypothetical protein
LGQGYSCLLNAVSLKYRGKSCLGQGLYEWLSLTSKKAGGWEFFETHLKDENHKSTVGLLMILRRHLEVIIKGLCPSAKKNTTFAQISKAQGRASISKFPRYLRNLLTDGSICKSTIPRINTRYTDSKGNKGLINSSHFNVPTCTVQRMQE